MRCLDGYVRFKGLNHLDIPARLDGREWGRSQTLMMWRLVTRNLSAVFVKIRLKMRRRRKISPPKKNGIYCFNCSFKKKVGTTPGEIVGIWFERWRSESEKTHWKDGAKRLNDGMFTTNLKWCSISKENREMSKNKNFQNTLLILQICLKMF